MIENKFFFVFCWYASWSQRPTVNVPFAPSAQLPTTINVLRKAYRHANCQCVYAGQMTRFLVVPPQPRKELSLQSFARQISIFGMQRHIFGVAP